MEITKTSVSDIEVLMAIFHEAQGTIAALGIDQWQNGYPSEPVVEDDVAKGQSFCVRKDGVICGTFVLVDHEPLYDNIEDGHWLTGDDGDDYIAMHRVAVAVAMRGQGVPPLMIEYAAEQARCRGKRSIRIDTHRGNVVMRRMLEKNGFNYCGIIHLANGDPRVAYEKILGEIDNMKKLGFGTMRLPKLSESGADIDHAQTQRMIDTYLERGFTYFDTAYMYHEGCSELAVREDLVKRHDRNSFFLADKLPIMRLKDASDMQRIFEEQREKCGVEYFDYYLLHNLNTRFFPVAEELGAFDFIKEKKEQGLARKIGFSFHAGADLLDEILTKYPFFDFVQLQINYLDWEHTGIQSRKCYEVARRHGKDIIVMEPVKGGTLANLPECAEALMRAYAPDASPASWAIRFAAGLEGVIMVLSGMSNYDQLCDNIGYMADFVPLNREELEIIRQVRNILYETTTIPCTACSYCTEGCPAEIHIPELFAIYNNELKSEAAAKRGETLEFEIAPAEAYAKHMIKASDCVGCGQCEAQCPQDLPVIKLLEAVARKFEK